MFGRQIVPKARQMKKRLHAPKPPAWRSLLTHLPRPSLWHGTFLHISDVPICKLNFDYWAPCSRALWDTESQRQTQADRTELLSGHLSVSLSLSLALSRSPSRAPAQIRAEPMTAVCVLVAAEGRIKLRSANVSRFTAADSEALISQESGEVWHQDSNRVISISLIN